MYVCVCVMCVCVCVCVCEVRVVTSAYLVLLHKVWGDVLLYFHLTTFLCCILRQLQLCVK